MKVVDQHKQGSYQLNKAIVYARIAVGHDFQVGKNETSNAWEALLPNILVPKSTLEQIEDQDVVCLCVLVPLKGPGFLRAHLAQGNTTAPIECILPPGCSLVLDCCTGVQQAIRFGKHGGVVLEMFVLVPKDEGWGLPKKLSKTIEGWLQWGRR